MSVTFDYPWLLLVALLLPAAVIGLMRRSFRVRQERLERFGAPVVVSRLVPPRTYQPPGSRITRLAAAGALAGVAVAGPRWGAGRDVVRSRGIDMALSLDVSLSMLATDARPSRMDQMKDEVRRLRAMSPGDRVGLLAFAGRSYVLSPLTVDDGALDLYLDNLDPSIVGEAGTSLAHAIEQGVDLLSLTNTGADRALVVMSDGEAFEPIADVVAQARRARDQGIVLVMVGFGTEQGSTIPVRDGDVTTLKRDDAGQIVITKYHPEFLQAAAEAAGGTFIDASATDKAGRVKSALSSLRSQARASLEAASGVLRYQWFLFPALLLLLLDTMLSERQGIRRPLAAAAQTAAGLLVTATISSCARFGRNPDAVAAYHQGDFGRSASLFQSAVERGDRNPATSYNLGTALVGAESLQTAAQVLDRLTDAHDSELRYRSLFNLGLAQLDLGLHAGDVAGRDAFCATLADYKKALIMRPNELDAKWNYELALRKAAGGGGGGCGGQSAQDQQSNAAQAPHPQGALGQRQADQLLGSAAREERDTQAKKQKQNHATPPHGAKDW